MPDVLTALVALSLSTSGAVIRMAGGTARVSG
jgi:hypothetical protein